MVDGGSAKFWEAAADGAAVHVRYGRIGTAGQLRTKELADPAAAAAHLARLIAEKERKGYAAAAVAEPAAAPAAPAAPVSRAEPAAEPVAPAALPDEDVFVLPAAWRAHVVPRRGGGVPAGPWRPSVGPEGAVEWEERLLAEEERAVEKVLSSKHGDPEVVRAVRAHLAGAPDPVGAAALAAVLNPRHADDPARRQFDSWVVRFGPEFAVRAALRALEVRGTPLWAMWQNRGVGFRRDPVDTVHAVTLELGLLAAARRMLAGAEEPVRQAALAALDGARDTPLRRAVIAYLTPERTALVDACLADPSASADPLVRTLLAYALGSAEQVARFGDADGVLRYAWRHELVATLADGAGTAGAPLVRAGAVPEGYAHDSEWYAEFLAAFPTDGTLAELIDRIADKHARVALLGAVERQPVRALRLLAAAARRGGSDAAAARRGGADAAAARRGGADAAAARLMLNGLVARLRSRLAELLPRLDEATAAFVRSLDGAREPLPEAAPAALPALLASPPWERPRAARPPKALTVPAADQDAELLWEEGESASFAAATAHYWQYPAATDWRAELKKAQQPSRAWDLGRLLVQGPDELVAPLLESLEPRALAESTDQLPPLLARFGTAALRLVLGAAQARPSEAAAVLLPVRGAAAAALMADVLVRLKSVQPVARSWFARHGVAGVLPLVPAAVGKAGRGRVAAEHALRAVAAREGEPVLLAAVAERYGEPAAAAVAEALASDPLETALPAKLPELPDWLRLEALPQVALAGGGGALPPQAVRNLVTMLQLSKPREPYPGLAPVAEQVGRAAAAGFGWAVFEEWRQAGMPAKDGWALYGLGGLGDDGTARRLAPVLREWPGQAAHQRAVEGLDVLASIGTDAALTQLHGIAQRVKFKALKSRAQERITEIAEALGLSAEQLGDRLVPALGLDADGTTVIDYGTRTFTVGFDEQLRPYVLDSDGRRRKDLPAVGTRDDQALASAERKRFTALKKDARTLAGDQLARLETAMTTERAWSAAEFTELLVGHPLLGHLVRRLLWTTGPDTFRVAEDRTLADHDDRPFTLPADATVRLAHPLHLDPAAAAAWGEVFADYELVQPFRQLGRPVVRLTEEEAAGHRLHRFEKHTVPVGRVLGLTARGWQRGTPMDAGVECWIHKPLPDGRFVVIALNPGIVVGLVNELGDQTFEAVWLGTAPGDYWPGRYPYDERFADLAPVTASEVLLELEELTSA
nr:DUF4132 domain-containing protein [Kitasatospora sp. SID7827]